MISKQIYKPEYTNTITTFLKAVPNIGRNCNE